MSTRAQTHLPAGTMAENKSPRSSGSAADGGTTDKTGSVTSLDLSRQELEERCVELERENRTLREQKCQSDEVLSTIIRSGFPSGIDSTLKQVEKDLDGLSQRGGEDVAHEVASIRSHLQPFMSPTKARRDSSENEFVEASIQALRRAQLDYAVASTSNGGTNNNNNNSKNGNINNSHSDHYNNNHNSNVSTKDNRSINTTMFTPDEQKAHTYLLGPNFRIFDHTYDELSLSLFKIFSGLGVVQAFKIDTYKFLRFIYRVQHSYHDNPYHSYRHACDVCQTVACLLNTCNREYFTPLDILSVLIASICHDIEHPGVSNNFLIKAKSPLAQFYNDQSVLENHHAAATFRILASPDANILSDLSASEAESARKTIVSCILLTDMGVHHHALSKLDDIILSPKPKFRSQADRDFLAGIFLKCADLGNIFKPFDESMRWSKLLNEEHIAQIEKEKLMFGEVTSKLSDSTEESVICANTVMFITTFAQPLFNNFETVFPQAASLFVEIKRNHERHNAIAAAGPQKGR